MCPNLRLTLRTPFCNMWSYVRVATANLVCRLMPQEVLHLSDDNHSSDSCV